MTTSSYGIEGLRTPLAMADAIERVSTLTGVTEVAVTLGHGAPSPLTVQSDAELSATELLDCLQGVGLRLVKAEGSDGPPARPVFRAPSSKPHGDYTRTAEARDISRSPTDHKPSGHHIKEES